MSWHKVPFDTLYAIPSKNGLTRPSRVRGSGYKMINMGELFGNDRIGAIDMELVPMSDKEIETMLVDSGDLLFARQSLVLSGAGKCSLVTNLSEPTTFESHIIRVRLDKTRANPGFYFYYFKSPISGIKSIVSQGVQAGIRGNDLKTLSVHLPPLDVQNRILNVLIKYDDLIENNRRRIQLLEDAARLLYREWFIYLRFPGHEHVKIVDGVPEGWKSTTMDNVCEYINRGISPTYDDDGEYLVINQKCIRNKLLNLDLARKQSKVYKEEKAVQLGDILINSTGTGTLGRVAQAWVNYEKTTIDSHVTIVRPNQDIPYLWLGYTLMSLEKVLEDMGEGATNQKELNRARIREIAVILPPKQMMEDFHSFVSPLVSQIQMLMQQNKKLTEARDLLLPRLMSGEISV